MRTASEAFRVANKKLRRLITCSQDSLQGGEGADVLFLGKGWPAHEELNRDEVLHAFATQNKPQD
jgi:hypothetical protein